MLPSDCFKLNCYLCVSGMWRLSDEYNYQLWGLSRGPYTTVSHRERKKGRPICMFRVHAICDPGKRSCFNGSETKQTCDM